MPAGEALSLSVVMPLYNGRRTVVAAVKSVIQQTHVNWELLVIDDGSQDDGAQLVEQIADPRIKVIRQANGGVSRARNVGLDHAQSLWVAFLDADDVWLESHLAELAFLCDQYPQAVLTASGFWYVDEHGHRLRSSIHPSLRAKGQAGMLLTDYCNEVHRHGVPFVTSSVMVHRETALAIGGFMPGVAAGEDLLMWVELACRGAVALTTSCSTLYTEPSMKAGDRPQVIRRPQYPDRVGERLVALVEQLPRMKSLRHFLADWHRMRAILWMELDDKRRCLQEVRAAIGVGGLSVRDVTCLLALMLPLPMRSRLLAWRRRVL